MRRSSTGQRDGVCHHLNPTSNRKGVGRREGKEGGDERAKKKRATRNTLDYSISCTDLTRVIYSNVTPRRGGRGDTDGTKPKSVNNLEYFISEQHSSTALRCHLGYSASFIIMVSHLSLQVNWDSNCSGEQLIHPWGKAACFTQLRSFL